MRLQGFQLETVTSHRASLTIFFSRTCQPQEVGFFSSLICCSLQPPAEIDTKAFWKGLGSYHHSKKDVAWLVNPLPPCPSCALNVTVRNSGCCCLGQLFFEAIKGAWLLRVCCIFYLKWPAEKMTFSTTHTWSLIYMITTTLVLSSPTL